MTQYTPETLAALFDGLTLETTIGARADDGEARTFQMAANKLPLVSIKKAMEYGFQRWLNDRVGGKDRTTKEKVEDTSIFLAKVQDGSWVRETSSRGPAVDLFTKLARDYVRKLVLAKSPDKLKGLKGDELSAYLDGVFVKNEAKFRPAVEKLVADEMAKRAEVNAIAADIEL